MRSSSVSMSVISRESTTELTEETTETMSIAPLSSAWNSVPRVVVSERSRSVSTGRTSASPRNAANTLSSNASVTCVRSPRSNSQWARPAVWTRLTDPAGWAESRSPT